MVVLTSMLMELVTVGGKFTRPLGQMYFLNYGELLDNTMEH